MQQLLQIENVPIKLEIKSTRAYFQKPEVPEAGFDSPTQGFAEIEKSAARKAAESSAGASYPARDQYVSAGRNDGFYAGMLPYAFSGNSGGESYGSGAGSAASDLVQAGIRNAQLQSAAASRMTHSEFVSRRMELYASERSNFELSVALGRTEMEFVPGSIEFTVTQKPAVNIEYVGSPIYVPRSADPNAVDVYA
ncbi:MAG: hypothetical protein ACI4VM_04080 [Anaerovoracaceae bacterium]